MEPANNFTKQFSHTVTSVVPWTDCLELSLAACSKVIHYTRCFKYCSEASELTLKGFILLYFWGAGGMCNAESLDNVNALSCRMFYIGSFNTVKATFFRMVYIKVFLCIFFLFVYMCCCFKHTL